MKTTKTTSNNIIKTAVLSIAALLILSINIYSQHDWAAVYNGQNNSNDGASAIVVDPAGNVYVTGYTRMGLDNRTDDYCTIKYNSSGVQQWIQRYDGTGNEEDHAVAIGLDAANNVYVTGSSRNGNGYSAADYVTLKYDNNGNIQWVQRFNRTYSADYPVAMAVDPSGNVYVTGSSRSASGGTEDYCTIKYNSSGVLQWTGIFNGAYNGEDYATAVTLDNSGNVIVTGYSYTSITNSDDIVTIKYSPVGVQQWVKIYNGTDNSIDKAKSVTTDLSGNVIVAGSSMIADYTLNYVTVKYSPAGSQIWMQSYNGPGNNDDEATAVAADVNGNIFVTGGGRSGPGAYSSDFTTIKYNPAGTAMWVQIYNGTGNNGDKPSSMKIDGTGNVYVTGYSAGSTSIDIATVKYTNMGSQVWAVRFAGQGNFWDESHAMAVDASSNVYVTGEADYNFITLKYSPLVGINSTNNEIPKGFELSQNFPNPFNPSTKISFSIPKSSFVKMVVFDVTGKEVETLVNENMNAGSYNVDFNASKLSSGVYFYRITTDGFSDTKKMILTK